MPAVAAAQAQEAVGQDAAFEEGVELVFDEPRQRGPGAGLGVGDEACRVLLHQAVQLGLLGAVAFVVEPVGWGGPRCARSRARRPPAGDRHGRGAAQSGSAQRRSDRRACPPPRGSLRWGMPMEGRRSPECPHEPRPWRRHYLDALIAGGATKAASGQRARSPPPGRSFHTRCPGAENLEANRGGSCRCRTRHHRPDRAPGGCCCP